LYNTINLFANASLIVFRMSTSLAVSFVNPDSLLQQIPDIAPGSTVADFGCGSGYFSLAFVKAVGKEGKVVALDILPSALEAVASRAKTMGLSRNVVTKRVNLEKENGSGLETASVDWVVIKDILFQNEDKETILKEAYRVLRPGGRVLLMEWKTEDASVGPDMSLRISMDVLKELVQRAGFSVATELRAGDFHAAFVLEK
jgi:ubiquinone/menaquinone biosynthesis C-methylase UbiE